MQLDHQGLFARLFPALCVVAVMAGQLLAQAQPPTQPASQPGYTQPGGRRGATRDPSPPHIARDDAPFTNESLTGLNPALPTLFVAGDSTAATGNSTTRGWAALLVDYFDTTKVNLVNQAQGGARFNTYMQGKWGPIVAAIKPGDFVVIEFGHNSGPLAGIGEETNGNIHTHGWYLRKFIADVREKKGIPIASTLTLRDLWRDGKVERLKEQTAGLGGMSDWTRQVAAAEKVLLVDHSNIIGDRYNKIGQEEGDKLFGDHYLHTNTAGAIINAEAFIAGLKALPDMPLVNYLNDKGKAIEAYKPAAGR